MKTEFLQQLKAVDDPAPSTPAPHFGAAEFHGVDAIALEAHVANGHGFTGEFFLGRSLDDGGASAPAKQQAGGVALGVAADKQHFFSLLRHHVAQIGQGEALADAAFAVDGNDLGLFGHSTRGHRRWLLRGFGAQDVAHEVQGGCCGNRACAHCICLQSKTIFKQSASPKAVR